MALPAQKKFLLPLFFLSGFSALIYEVIWARMLTLVFGSTVEAISAVVTAFMAGLAVGSYFMGKWADRRNNTLLIYSITEFGIGIVSLFFYFIIIYLPDIHSTFHDIVDIKTSFVVFNNSGYIMDFLLVFIPATLMGATFPLMVKSYVSSRNYVGEGMSVIYAINTLGAVFGAFSAGFLLIPYFGVMRTVFIAVTINILLAMAAYLIKRVLPLRPAISVITPIPPAFQDNDTSRPLAPISHTEPIAAFSVLLVMTLSGFASLAYQIAWTRVLTMVIGNSVYAFATILTTFLAGIAIGSFAFIRHIDRVKDKILLLGILQLSLWLSVVTFLPRVDSLPSIFLALFRHLPANFTGIIFIEFIVTFTVVLLPTILMGASFPVAARIYINTVDSIGEGLGRLYAVNTVGAIFGSFLTGFIFIPALGVQKTIFFISALNLFSGIILIGQAGSLRKTWRISVPAFSVIFFLYFGATNHDWNKNLLNRGVYVYAEWLKKLPEMGADLDKFSSQFELLYYEEGRGGTVAVSKTRDRVLSLQINGKTDASTSDADMQTQIMIAALPLLTHPDPEEIAIVGLGSGVTLGAAERFPLKKIECIEIIPEVVKANRYFTNFNHNALDDPRVSLIIGDARRHLTVSRKKYDIIIDEPSNPWIAGSSNLFTLEFFRLVKDRLNENGILCQWFNLYTIDTSELKILLNTFRTVFPHVTVWAFSEEDLIILGSNNPLQIDEDRLDYAFSEFEIKKELLRAGIVDKDRIKSAYLIGNNELERFCKGAGLNTDNRPVIEFEAPKRLYRPTTEKNISAILSSASF
ncbi:MAG: fused MFS/spermidine synthase [Deltaproteobacteria bacterium]|nr:fused MFS/spermidine synthase [Deltaproteobacteria bacterium]